MNEYTMQFLLMGTTNNSTGLLLYWLLYGTCSDVHRDTIVVS